MIILTFTDDAESFTVITTSGKEAIALVEAHSSTSHWPYSWAVDTPLRWGYDITEPSPIYRDPFNKEDMLDFPLYYTED